MADWVDAYHAIEVSYFEDKERGQFKGAVWMDKDTMHVEMEYELPFPIAYVPNLRLADEPDDG